MSEDQAKLIIMVVGCILVALGFLVLCVCLGIAEIKHAKIEGKKEDKNDE